MVFIYLKDLEVLRVWRGLFFWGGDFTKVTGPPREGVRKGVIGRGRHKDWVKGPVFS